MDQKRLEKEPDSRGHAKQGRGEGCESSKILSLQRPGLCVSMAVSDVLWKRKLQGKEGSLLLGEEGHKVLKSDFSARQDTAQLPLVTTKTQQLVSCFQTNFQGQNQTWGRGKSDSSRDVLTG